MTTYVTAKEAIYQRFVDNFTGVVAGYITFENEKFDPPVGSNWVRLTIRSQTRIQSTLGKITNRKFRSTGLVIIQVFTVVDVGGVHDADVLANEAANIFEGVSFAGLDFNSAVQTEIGPDNTWYQVNVEAEFDFDEIK